MLTRKKIEGALRGHVASPGLSIREALETALALYQENERLKDNIDGWKAVMKKTIGADAADAIKGLEAENARLREALDETEKLLSLLGEDCPKLQTKIQKLEIENARLREENIDLKDSLEDCKYELEKKWADHARLVDGLKEAIRSGNQENARLLEADESAKRVIDGLVATQDILQRDIDLLRAVVEAALKEGCRCDDRIYCDCCKQLEAALKRLEGK